MTIVKKILMTSLMSLFALSSGAQADDENFLSVSSVGRGAKLVLNKDLLIPANKADISMLEVSRANSFVASCEVNMREASLDSRVIKAGHEIVFSGIVAENNTGTTHFHTLEVSNPDAVKSVTCHADKLDIHGQWHPTTAIIWDLKASFADIAILQLADPVEIPN
jgi:hypothetical protein